MGGGVVTHPQTTTGPEQRDRIAYRPSLDGIRGLAVLAVIIYHFSEEWLPGGFLGVDVFFVTNRSCELREDSDGPCPQEQGVIDLVAEIGIETDAEHVMLAFERPEWNKEKLSRREHVGATHRVIMLFGDDYGDFVACSRATPGAPCTKAATRSSRNDALDTYKDYWGNGWYILPNPMYGSWTSVQ